ncbi:hypothetical protein Tco_0781903 [Tanacetum coccineum]
MSIDKGRRYKEEKRQREIRSFSPKREASLAEAIRLDTYAKEEVAKQVHLDSLLAQRIAEEEELNEQQKKRKDKFHLKAQVTIQIEDWDLIRAKIEANAELIKDMEVLSQLKNLSFKKSEEFGDNFFNKDPKRLKDDEDVKAKDDEPTKKSGKRRKQMARKGLHTSVDKDDSEGSDEDSEQDDSVTGDTAFITELPLIPVPVAMKTPSIATYKIFKQGEKGAYQIVREDGTDVVYINFGAMLKVISRDDLNRIYRIFTMSNQHKSWLVQEQMALGKDFSNPALKNSSCKDKKRRLEVLQIKNNSKNSIYNILGKLKVFKNSNSYLRDILGKDMYYPLTFVKPIRVSLVYKRNPKAHVLYKMVVKEIKDGLLEEMEVSHFRKEQHIGSESEDDKEKKLVMVNEEEWMS